MADFGDGNRAALQELSRENAMLRERNAELEQRIRDMVAAEARRLAKVPDPG
jgi:cell division protein FtsB